MTAIIEAEGVGKIFDGRSVVDSVNIKVDQGSIHGIVGANGAGKSTLLRMLMGLYQPTSGDVRVFGESLRTHSPAFYQRVHAIAADVSPYSDLRVRAMLSMARSMYKGWNPQRERQLMDAFELSTRPWLRTLSVGMRMQLRFVIALAASPELLILDEATSGLDPLVKRQLLKLLVEMAAADNMTIVMATHELGDIERIADAVSVMLGGRIVASDSLDALRARIREVTCIFEGELPSRLHHHADVLDVRQHGVHLSMRVQNDESRFIRQLHELGATHIDVHPLDFADVFDTLMESGGYRRDRIHVS